MPYYEIWRGTGRVKLPLCKGVPMNRIDALSNWAWYEDEEKARADAYRAEHIEFGHDTPKQKCPVCRQKTNAVNVGERVQR